MSVTPIHDRIFFTFVENLTNNNFMPKTQSGIFLTDMYDFSEVHKPKWGKVVKHGPRVSDELRNAGEYILIEAGKWTTRITFDEQDFWQTEESFILATAANEADTFRY